MANTSVAVIGRGIASSMPEMLQYYAGFIDGEGHIGIKKSPPRGGSKNPSYSERISVAGTSELTIKGFQELWPGTFYYHSPGKNSRSGYWSWELTDKKAREFLTIIAPYLRVKGLDANMVLALGRAKERNGRKELAPEDVNLREDLYGILKSHRRASWLK